MSTVLSDNQDADHNSHDTRKSPEDSESLVGSLVMGL